MTIIKFTISSEMDSLEAERQRVKNSFDPFEHYMYFESSSYVSSSDGQFHDTAWPKGSNGSFPSSSINSNPPEKYTLDEHYKSNSKYLV